MVMVVVVVMIMVVMVVIHHHHYHHHRCITMTTLGNRPKQSSSRESDRGPDGGNMADEDVPSK